MVKTYDGMPYDKYLKAVEREKRKKKGLKRVKRSKTFNTHIDGVKQSGFNKAYKFFKSRPKGSSASMESYGVGKNRRIARAVVYWYEDKKVGKKRKPRGFNFNIKGLI